jgi:hypothetical protein
VVEVVEAVIPYGTELKPPPTCEPDLELELGLEVGFVEVDVVCPAALHVVVTRQLAQEKLMTPAEVDEAVWPINLPDELIETPAKSIHPVFAPHALPEIFPLPSLITPPFVGARFIHP